MDENSKHKEKVLEVVSCQLFTDSKFV